MGSLLRSTKNTRTLPTGTLKYIRSDAPVRLSEEEIEWLLDNNITTLIDLRTDEEIAQRPCCLSERAGFEYIRLPVTGGGEVPMSREQLHAVYRQMADEKTENTVGTIMNAKSNVMYFCTAGKDRTGVVSAVLLKRLGFSDEVIIEDYMESLANLSGMLISYAKAHPEVDPEVIIPRRDNMERLLEYLKQAEK